MQREILKYARNTLQPMFETFSRSWEITKQTFRVINADREILLYPVVSSIISIIFFVVMVFPFIATGLVSEILSRDAGAFLFWVTLFGFYLGVSFVATFFNVATVYCANKRFHKGNPTFTEGLKEAFKRIHLIFLWSLVSATVGILINSLENSAKKSKGISRVIISAVASLVGMAWSIVTLFVIPAIVIENVGPVDAIKRSAQTLKKTWGESLIRHFGLGAAQGMFSFAGFFFLLAPAIVSLVFFQSILMFAVLMALFIIYIVIVSLVFSTANTVFNTALFVYAKTGKIPGFYSKDTMKHAFKAEKK
ncbi:hypothetical protein QT06_C0001G0938 [archaeon GW2011_AR15]|nr:hypothetical protein QT06_C0001G0938 [archaeon GW2011_AR15]